MKSSRGFLFVGLLVLSCGHNRLQYRVDDAMLADIPPQQKTTLIQTQADVERARQEQALADSNIQVDDRDLDVADASRKQARLERDKADDALKLARSRGDVAQIQGLEARRQLAEQGIAAVEARQAWLRERREAHRRAREVADARLRAAEARVENERARLAAAYGRRRDAALNLAAFDNQVRAADQSVREREIEAQQRYAQSEQLRQRFDSLVADYRARWEQLADPKPAFLPAPSQESASLAPPPRL